jgi:hypothetical protein
MCDARVIASSSSQNRPPSSSAGRVKGEAGEAGDRSEAKITLDASEHDDTMQKTTTTTTDHQR